MLENSHLLHRDVADKNDKPSAYLGGHMTKSVDPLASAVSSVMSSKRNALLKWCQNRTASYTVCIGICCNCHSEMSLL